MEEGARINRRRLTASLSRSGGGKGSYRLSRSRAFRFVFAGHGINPQSNRGAARAFADADAWWRATSREATAIVRGRRSGAHTRAGWNRGRGVGPGSYGRGEARQESGFGIPNP